MVYSHDITRVVKSLDGFLGKVLIVDIIEDKLYGHEQAERFKSEFQNYEKMFPKHEFCINLSGIEFFDTRFLNNFKAIDLRLKRVSKDLSLIVPKNSPMYDIFGYNNPETDFMLYADLSDYLLGFNYLIPSY